MPTGDLEFSSTPTDCMFLDCGRKPEETSADTRRTCTTPRRKASVKPRADRILLSRDAASFQRPPDDVKVLLQVRTQSHTDHRAHVAPGQSQDGVLSSLPHSFTVVLVISFTTFPHWRTLVACFSDVWLTTMLDNRKVCVSPLHNILKCAVSHFIRHCVRFCNDQFFLQRIL